MQLKIWLVGNRCGADSKHRRNEAPPPPEKLWGCHRMRRLTLGLTPRILDVRVLDFAKLGLPAREASQLTVVDGDSWSAMTLQLDGTFAIVLNPAHAITRQRNDLMHELAHIELSMRRRVSRFQRQVCCCSVIIRTSKNRKPIGSLRPFYCRAMVSYSCVLLVTPLQKLQIATA